jgi:hypothetical protein
MLGLLWKRSTNIICAALFSVKQMRLSRRRRRGSGLFHVQDKSKKLTVGEFRFADRIHHFDVATLSAAQFTQILGSNSTRCISFIVSNLTTEQSVLLATRPYSLNLELNRYATDEGLSDEGTAFVDALENRQHSFGSLRLNAPSFKPVMSRENLEQLLRLNSMIDKLGLRLMHEDIVLIPFVARVNALDYDIKARHIRPEDFEGLDILTKDLSLAINLEGPAQWSQVLISVLTGNPR